MGDTDDKYNWKKVFKKILEPPKPDENKNIQQIDSEKLISVDSCSFVDQKKSVSSVISRSPASSDTGYSGCKSDNVFEPNLNFPQASDYKSKFNSELLSNPPLNHGLRMNKYETNGCKTKYNNDLSPKKLPTRKFQTNISQTSGCKPEFNRNIPFKTQLRDRKEDIPHIWDVAESKKNYNIHHSKVPEWNKVFKSILADKSSIGDVPPRKIKENFISLDPPQKDPSKETGNFKNSDTSRLSSQKKQSNYMTKRRYEKAEKYNDYKVIEAEKKAKEIFARCRIFKQEKFNINDFDGCGVDLFKKDQTWSIKSTYGSYEYTDKPHLPLTGFVAKSKPYTGTDVAASYVPFGEDA